MTSKSEVWKSHPDIPGLQVSTLGRVRTLDKMVSNGKGMRLVKGHVLNPFVSNSGYVRMNFRVNGKRVNKSVHRLVAQTFIENPNNLPQVNHKDCDRANNNVENLEWCTASYNSQYREKYGVSRAEAAGKPVFAINLSTLEVTHFQSQNEAGQALGINKASINIVIKGKIKQAGGYYFKEDDGNGVEIDKDKLNDIADSMHFTGGVFAVNLKTLEVSRFNSQSEASLVLGASVGNINNVIKGRYRYTKGYWFVRDDGHAVDVVKSKLHDIGGTGLKIKQGR